ncbi:MULTISPECIES: hypothetical protein [unclassified Leclercia]|uniref:Uncharacterized protein n=1 Tax=Leclercia barmai TaxID=2785629 RepID=A0ABS7RYV3_9ENTR|nr:MULTISPECIES: hypothetical protein [unclassified Leclercia]MBZ0059489.1 hypothetical protein [Leclercia sp. EMC7]MCM5697379.1 hypothetical protein [Leclercia sp. LTM01]MCM5702027.1 hypothetical protein [Leclercia sp. LTM14]
MTRNTSGKRWDEAIFKIAAWKLIPQELANIMSDEEEQKYQQSFIELAHDGFDGR